MTQYEGKGQSIQNTIVQVDPEFELLGWQGAETVVYLFSHRTDSNKSVFRHNVNSGNIELFTEISHAPIISNLSQGNVSSDLSFVAYTEGPYINEMNRLINITSLFLTVSNINGGNKKHILDIQNMLPKGAANISCCNLR